MTTKAKKKTQKTVIQRNKYTLEHKEKAKRYYILGLNLHEISKLLDGCPVRTLEKWQQIERWTDFKQLESIKQKTFELHENGRSYSEIAELLKISRPTVWRYLKEVRDSEND